MNRIAWVCSAIALGSAMFAYSIIRLGFPAVGFEGAVWLGALLFWFGALTAVIAALLCVASFVRARSPMIWPFVCAGVAGLVLAITARS